MSEILQQEFNTLPSQTRKLMERADGYLDLRMPHRARDLLNQLPDSVQDMNIYRTFTMRLYMEEKRWKDAADTAAYLMKAFPDNSEFVINLAYAVRRCKDIEQAKLILEDGLMRFPEQPIFSYNLACYAAVLGDTRSAMLHLERAIEQDADYREMALDDEDLERVKGLF